MCDHWPCPSELWNHWQCTSSACHCCFGQNSVQECFHPPSRLPLLPIVPDPLFICRFFCAGSVSLVGLPRTCVLISWVWMCSRCVMTWPTVALHAHAVRSHDAKCKITLEALKPFVGRFRMKFNHITSSSVKFMKPIPCPRPPNRFAPTCEAYDSGDLWSFLENIDAQPNKPRRTMHVSLLTQLGMTSVPRAV